MLRKLFFGCVAIMLISLPVMADPAASPFKEYFPNGLLDREGKEVSLDVLQGKYVGIYFSAGWCPSCQQFSPKMVPFRDKNVNEFEVVFVSWDKTEEAQFSYMKEYGMFWPTLKWHSIPTYNLKNKFQVSTIPTLVVLSPLGELVTRDGRYDVQSNPDGALEKWKAIHGLRHP